MAQPANSFSSNDAIGNREDLTDVIYNVDPTETPFFSMISKTNADNVLHEWQTDNLAAASASNAVVEGNDTTVEAITPTTRLGNRTQILEKSARVTGTQEAINKAGRDREMAYQKVKKTLEIRRDLESSLLQNGAAVAGNDVTARQLAGINSWYTTNTSAGATGADATGDGTDTRTDGTQRAFTEDLLKTVLQSIWTNGGQPTCLMTGAFNREVFSGFTGSSTRFDKGEDKRLTATVEVYVGDFSTLTVVSNRFQRARDAHILQKDMWAWAELRPISVHELATTGDSEACMINIEGTLVARNEQASGIVADLTTS